MGPFCGEGTTRIVPLEEKPRPGPGHGVTGPRGDSRVAAPTGSTTQLKYPGGYQLPAEQVHPVPGLGLVQVDVELVPAISGGIQSPFSQTQPATGAVPVHVLVPAMSGGSQSPFLQTQPATGAVPGQDVVVVGGFQLPFTHVHQLPCGLHS